MANGHLRIFEKCTALQKIRLLNCRLSDGVSMVLPSQLKIFELVYSEVDILDASKCTQLECL
jgi:hypothetical protein